MTFSQDFWDGAWRNVLQKFVSYMGPICLIHYAVRRREKYITWLKAIIYTPLESQRQELSFWTSNSGNRFSRNYTTPTTISWSDWTLSRAEFLYTVKASILIYRTEHHAPRAPKRRGSWRPKRRRGGIDTASRATNFDTQQKLRLLLNASSVYWTPAISLNRIRGSTRPSSWPDGGGCHGSSFLVIS